ncbi:hypothetical protein NS365_20290 [Aureimonas ureilytica]|uniref:Murein endopeptidase K n=1 Tax=Aureimonas ureilytica TaxID=401562 RepID=A0A175RGN3_9HYPH|nr:D-Ala-D-Ala carboxypeptidase family metallohydrolase [Aureimonas ureilytica]KTR02866.1 hypothetical protein NS365_20290 [Aureimonas ureilytica]
MDERLTTKSYWRQARCVWIVAGLASASSLVTGCVSAVDETSAFGFSHTPKANEPKDIASIIQSDGKATPDVNSPPEVAAPSPVEPAKKQAETLRKVASGDIAKSIAAPAPADRQAPMQVATADRPADAKSRSLLTPLSAPVVTAFSQPRSGGPEADHSLYASLYTQSEAKVPLRNADRTKSKRVIIHQAGSDDKQSPADNGLPGVNPKSLFEIGQRASVDSELIDDLGDSYQLASLSGIARLAPSGLLIQREDVVTNCFDSNLMSLISQIETRFHQKVVITSGFRSPSHNRRVNGAKASLHMQCKAADLHVPGVNGQEVARFVRALPVRGGVGTYCHTASIHIDVGPRRDWNWPCRGMRRTG